MGETFDAIVVGSGFGGSVLACRLSQQGMAVLVLERGRRWEPATYPRAPTDPWFYSAQHPQKQHGWLDLRFFPRMIVAQAAGVGGGSLSYSSVALKAHPSCFEHGWPAPVTSAELDPYYDVVGAMLRLQALPDGQQTERLRLTREAATRLGHGARFSTVPLAVSFSPDWHYGLDEPFDPRHSATFVNPQGVTQGTCIHLGNCDIGCDVRAKNGLDVTYLPLAERHGCQVRPLHLVRSLATERSGYRVTFDRITPAGLARGTASAARVFLAAGSLGSTELLLRARDEHDTLPGLSPRLGQRWSANANVLSMADYREADRVRQSVGPTITAAVDFMDGTHARERFVVQDDGFPDLLLHALRAATHDKGAPGDSVLPGDLKDALRNRQKASGLMLWLGAGVDAGDGRVGTAPAVAPAIPPRAGPALESRRIAWRDRGDPRHARRDDRDHRRQAARSAGLATARHAGDLASARRLPDGRDGGHRRGGSPRPGLRVPEPVRRGRRDHPGADRPQPVADHCGAGRAHRRAREVRTDRRAVSVGS